jgi:hypothetical protein
MRFFAINSRCNDQSSLPPGTVTILSIIRDRLKPSGKFLAHELLVRSNEAQVRKNLSQAIRVNANPLSLAEWKAACENAGLTL